MDLRSLLLFQAVSNYMGSVVAQFVIEGCLEGNVSETSKAVQLSCRNGNIFSVDVQAGMGACKKAKEGCLGKTPTLLVEQLNCHWRTNCVINWPRDPIIMATNGESCIGSYPASVWVRYKCINPTDYYVDAGVGLVSTSADSPVILLADICSNTISGSSIYTRSGSAGFRGIIRSHKFYPWSYSSEQRNCSMKISWPEDQKLLITVHNIDLGEDDSLVIGHEKPVLVEEERNFEIINEEMTYFNFTVQNDSKSGEGFVICFSFIETEASADVNVCDTVTSAGSVVITGTGGKEARTTVAPAEATTQLPKRCRKKKSEKAKKRCAARMAGRKGKGRKGKKKRDKGRRKKKDDKSKEKKRPKRQ